MRDDTRPRDAEGASDPPDLPAGELSAWLRATRRALESGRGADVPCGTCTACCTSAYFIHIGPDESRTLRRIPKKLLFPAPGLPKGHVLLGYDERGHCPMLRDGQCSIYADRPQTCRSYDCRVFSAAGIEAGGDDKAQINLRIRRWKFSYASTGDAEAHVALRDAARFLREHAELFPAGTVPGNPAQLAILAVRVCDVFANRADVTESADRTRSDREIADAILEKLGPALGGER